MLSAKDESKVFLENNVQQGCEKIQEGMAKNWTNCLVYVFLAVTIVWLAISTILIVDLKTNLEDVKSELGQIRRTCSPERLQFLDALRESKLLRELNDIDQLERKGGLEELFATEDDSYEYEDEDDYQIGPVMETRIDEQPSIKKIMMIPNDDLEQLERSKREVIDKTPDGVPVLDEPYRVSKAKNFSQLSPEHLRKLPEIDKASEPIMLTGWNTHRKKLVDSTTPTSITTRTSRVMVTDDDRKVVRVRKPMTKSGLSSDYMADALEHRLSTDSIEDLRKKRKNRSGNRRSERIELSKDVERMAVERMVAHFDGDTSDYRLGYHEHYDGNGRLRHPHDVAYTAWAPAPWLRQLGTLDDFPLRDGEVTIPQTGLYFVYAQIHYHDEHDTNSFRVYRNRSNMLLQCTTMTHSSTRINKSNSCYTAGAFHLTVGDQISIKNLGGMRYSIMEAGKSFFGIVQL